MVSGLLVHWCHCCLCRRRDVPVGLPPVALAGAPPAAAGRGISFTTYLSELSVRLGDKNV
uniref:Uncharacterized protein n=1 Tax=Oryza nivara TaxID=4536 RepID=A0A0E0HKF9_ORYNI